MKLKASFELPQAPRSGSGGSGVEEAVLEEGLGAWCRRRTSLPRGLLLLSGRGQVPGFYQTIWLL